MSNNGSLLPKRVLRQSGAPMLSTAAVPFTLRVSGDTRTGGLGSAFVREHDVRGLARLEGEELVLEWSGSTKVSDVRGFAAEVRVEPFPPGRRAIPLGALASIGRRGWWRRRRVELRVAELGALEGVPGAAGSLLALMIAHADLESAGRLVIATRSVVRALREPLRA